MSDGSSGGEGHELVRVIVCALERVGSGVEERYLLQTTCRNGPWRLLGSSLPKGDDPFQVAKQLVEVQLGGVAVGWDLRVEPLSASPDDFRNYLFQGFFVRPVWEFQYLWAGDGVRWFSREKIDQGKEMDKETQSLLSRVVVEGALPNTWSQYLHRRYSEAWRTALQTTAPWSGELVMGGVAPHHRAGLGAVLRRRLLAGDAVGQRLLRRVAFTESENGVQVTLEWCRQAHSYNRADRAFLEQAWESLSRACDADLINGGELET